MCDVGLVVPFPAYGFAALVSHNENLNSPKQSLLMKRKPSKQQRKLRRKVAPSPELTKSREASFNTFWCIETVLGNLFSVVLLLESSVCQRVMRARGLAPA